MNSGSNEELQLAFHHLIKGYRGILQPRTLQGRMRLIILDITMLDH